MSVGPNNFPNRDGNEAGFIDPGYTSHRGGNFIKAFLFLQALAALWARLMRKLKTLVYKARSTAARCSSVFIDFAGECLAVSIFNLGRFL